MLLLILCPILFMFLGYVFHRFFHFRMNGFIGGFYRAHMRHHIAEYPPSNFYSDEYRYPGKDNTTYLFAIVFAPIVLFFLGLILFKCIPIWVGAGIFLEMFIIGWLNNSLHDSFHLRKTFCHRFSWFDKLIKLHYNHHLNMDTNFGIFSFMFDRLFGTFYK